jgi:hypothetical protein
MSPRGDSLEGSSRGPERHIEWYSRIRVGTDSGGGRNYIQLRIAGAGLDRWAKTKV